MDQQSITISRDGISLTVDYRGAQMVRLEVDGKEILWGGDPAFWAGHAPILFPICGGVIDGDYCLNGAKYPMKKHGFIRFQNFALLKKEQDSVTFVFEDNEESRKSFPFSHRFSATYQIVPSGVEITYRVENLDEKTMYFGLGGHEGYALDAPFEEYSLFFEKDEDRTVVELAGDLLSTATKSLYPRGKEIPLRYEDYSIDALVFRDIASRKAALVHKKKGKVLEVEFPDAKHLVLWTKPGAQYICIEPWSALHDVVGAEPDITKKKDILSLNKGETYVFKHSIWARNL